MTFSQTTRRRWTRQSHRWLGVIVLIPLIITSITGVILNHTVDLNLSEKHVTASWVQSRYGMVLNEEPLAFGLKNGPALAASWDGQIFYQKSILTSKESLTAAVPLRDGLALTTLSKVYYYGLDGELIETLDELTLPQGDIIRAGRTDNLALVLETNSGIHISDRELLSFSPLKTHKGIIWSEKSIPSEATLQQWKESFFGKGIPMDRVILDIHSGRFFGSIGKWAWDILVIGILVLSISGFVLFLRYQKRKS